MSKKRNPNECWLCKHWEVVIKRSFLPKKPNTGLGCCQNINVNCRIEMDGMSIIQVNKSGDLSIPDHKFYMAGDFGCKFMEKKYI